MKTMGYENILWVIALMKTLLFLLGGDCYLSEDNNMSMLDKTKEWRLKMYMSNEDKGKKEGLKAKIKTRRKRAKDKDH